MSTTQIDGETDLKVRKPYPKTYEIFKRNKNYLEENLEFEINREGLDLDNFEGNVKYLENGTNRVLDIDPILLDNTVWSGCKIVNNEVFGLVIAVGKDTCLERNSQTNKIMKHTQVDKKVNIFSILLFLMMVILGFGNAIFQGALNFGIRIFLISISRFIILLSFLIPISLRMFLMMARIGFSRLIMNDKEIEGTVVKNETIIEELGTIDIILSDKTGTITKNEMYMDKISIKENIYNCEEIKNKIKNYYKGDITEITKDMNQIALSLVICNNVTFKRDEEGNSLFDASSPDEIAMVEYFEEIGFSITQRDDKYIKFKDLNDKEISYEIIKLFPFESSRKRMGIIVKDLNEKKDIYYFYLKGADGVIKTRVGKQSDKIYIEEKTFILASEGLRTLCFSYKVLEKKEFDEFAMIWKKNLLKGLKKKNEDLLENLEHEMDYLGITAVKDLLQNDVPKTFIYIEQALVKIWILTGDKLETAAHICRSIGIVKPSRKLKILTLENKNELKTILEETNLRQSVIELNKVLLLNGKILEFCLENHREKFIKYCLTYKFVCFARCSPIQKYQIASILKKEFHKIVLSIGDGGNDVGMIQQANVGIGIRGKEGNQAALAADFTINEFSHLSKLVFYHGRNTYRGLASISQFILHRGLIISWIQEIFSVMFYMLSLPVYNGFMMTTYSAVFTILPVFSVIFDVDVQWSKLSDYLHNYRQSSRGLSFKNFLIWNIISLYQAVAIFIGGFYFFNNFLSNFIEITFTSLILAETFNIMLLVPRCSKWLWSSILVTFILYVICVFVFPESFNVHLFDVHFFVNVLKIFVISWLPVFLVSILYKIKNKEITDLV